MVKVVRPDWAIHVDDKERPQTIYSISVHPDKTRVATGGLDTKIRIWNCLPILDEAKERDASCYKCLATLTSHSGTVNHLKWSSNGKYLASGSDDQIVMVWTKQAGSGGKAFGSTEENHENWFPVKRLVGHSADVTGVAWNQDDSYLASVALDGSVIIWNGYTFEIEKRLVAHDGFLKGVIWDPVGQYLATQADDNSMRIWRTTDWQLEQDIRKPFVDCPKPNLLRPSWSPEGTHIVAPNAMNGPIFVAAVVERTTWTSNTSLVGHSDVVEVAAFNPKVFLRDPTQPPVGANLCTVLALCSRSNLSVWITRKNSPIVVFREVFDRDILDVSWSPDGSQLWCCSSEGHIAVFEFDMIELGVEAPAGALDAHRKSYGFTPRVPLKPIGLQDFNVQRVGTLDNPNKLMVRKGPGAKRRVVPAQTPAVASASAPALAPNAFQPPIQDSLPSRMAPFANDGNAFASTSRLPPNSSWTGAIAGGSPGAARKRRASVMMQDVDALDDDNINPFERVSAYPNRIKGRALGDGVPPPDIQLRVLKPAYVRDVDFAITNEREKTAQPALAVPAVTTFGSLRIVDGDPGDMFEYRNLTEGDLKGNAEVRVRAGAKTIWFDFLPRHVVVAAGSPSICAVSLEDSSLRCWSSSSGRTALPILVLDSPCAFLNAEGHFLMAITALGTLTVWNVNRGQAIIGPIRVGPLLSASATRTTPRPTISTSSLLPNGTPLIALDSGSTHSFDAGLQAWTRLSEAWWERSNQWEGRRGRATNTVGRGIVRNIESAINDIIVDAKTLTTPAGAVLMDTRPDGQLSQHAALPPNGAPQTGGPDLGPADGSGGVVEGAATALAQDVIGQVQEPTQDEGEMKLAITLGHLETRMRTASALDSPGEYKMFLLAYAKIIGEEGIRNKAEELIKELLGPIYFKPGSKDSETWSSTIVGLQKRDLLRDVLNSFLKSRLLAGLAQEHLDLLKRMNAS